jgi:histidyl-tRNA synthetase
MQGQGLPGFRDFYPEDAALRNRIFTAWRTVAGRYGFEEYDGPPLEPLELYTQKSGAEIVGQLYEFTDKGDRRVALRPEMTPTLARMVAARAQGLKKPIRWFSMPQLFRYERQQRGRLREHFQLNMDLIGEPGALGDAEIIAAAIDVMRALGLGPKDVRVRMSDRRVLSALLRHAGVPEEDLGAAYVAVDRLERSREVGDLVGLSLAHAIHSKAEIAQRVMTIARIRDWPSLDEALRSTTGGLDAAGSLYACRDALGAMGLGEFLDVDLSIVRGLAYYTGIVFELFDANKSLRAICGGGRYDGLLKALGGVDLPAVGFGMGDVVLGELVKQVDPGATVSASLDAFLVPVTAADFPTVLRLAHDLRERGLRIEYALREQAIGKQLKLAAARPAKRAVLIGPDERTKGEALVRNMNDGAEERVSLTQLVNGYAWA